MLFFLINHKVVLTVKIKITHISEIERARRELQKCTIKKRFKNEDELKINGRYESEYTFVWVTFKRLISS